jgi:hypothetical protein
VPVRKLAKAAHAPSCPFAFRASRRAGYRGIYPITPRAFPATFCAAPTTAEYHDNLCVFRARACGTLRRRRPRHALRAGRVSGAKVASVFPHQKHCFFWKSHFPLAYLLLAYFLHVLLNMIPHEEEVGAYDEIMKAVVLQPTSWVRKQRIICLECMLRGQGLAVHRRGRSQQRTWPRNKC